MLPSAIKNLRDSFALWLLLNSLDVAITWLGFLLGMQEGNPFLRIAADTYGPAIMLLMRITLAVLLGILVWKRESLTFNLKILLNTGMFVVILVNCVLVGVQLWHLA
ncbi:MAG: DUF5658 family protein [Chloroflexota bacterium]|nr:DUF5658 family protein [Chloroflexota bacterium]